MPVERLVARKDDRFAEAAAMFQLEIGIGVIGLSSPAAAGHFDLGHKLLRSTQPRLQADATQDQLTFWATWYGVAAADGPARHHVTYARCLAEY